MKQKRTINEDGQVLVEVFDGRARYDDLPRPSLHPWVGIRPASQIMVPVTIHEGCEDCGSGAMIVEGGVVRCAIPCATENLAIYYAAHAGPDSRWRNYGAPNGTYTKAVLVWEEIPAQDAERRRADYESIQAGDRHDPYTAAAYDDAHGRAIRLAYAVAGVIEDYPMPTGIRLTEAHVCDLQRIAHDLNQIAVYMGIPEPPANQPEKDAP
jgi:hypothetical protein